MSDHRDVAVVGAGPGGLYAALLIKRARPSWEVRVFERNAAQKTYGFGIGLTPATMKNLTAADTRSAHAIAKSGWSARGLELRVDDFASSSLVARMPDRGAISIGRDTLLAVLTEEAERLGVQINSKQCVRVEELDADVVIAADGHASTTRAGLSARFGAEIQAAQNRYLWCGADFALPHVTFAPATDPSGAVFVAHAYPYAADRSTVLFEIDHKGWLAAGMDEADDRTRASPSDTISVNRLATLFADLLGGRPLLSNRSRWKRFVTVRCARWHDGRVVLLGDAAHTAHYSIGSGTKLALEDGIELAHQLTATHDRADALERYEAVRQPAVRRFQALAISSQQWWDTFPRRKNLGASRVLCSFMTRTGSIRIDAIFDETPEVLTDAVTDYAGVAPPPGALVDISTLTAWVVQRPLPDPGPRVPTRVVTQDRSHGWRAGGSALRVVEVAVPVGTAWGQAGGELVATCRRQLAKGHDAVWLCRDAATADLPVSAMHAFAERVRLDGVGPVGVDIDARWQSDALTVLVTGRADLIRFQS